MEKGRKMYEANWESLKEHQPAQWCKVWNLCTLGRIFGSGMGSHDRM